MDVYPYTLSSVSFNSIFSNIFFKIIHLLLTTLPGTSGNTAFIGLQDGEWKGRGDVGNRGWVEFVLLTLLQICKPLVCNPPVRHIFLFPIIP